MVAVSVPAVVFLAVPTVVVFVALVIGAAAEWIAYVPLRLLRRDRSKEVNAPDPGDVFLS